MSRSDRHIKLFIEEAGELLVEFESALLELESCPNDREAVGRIFRAVHTIKGSSSMFGLEDISSVTHEMETAFDLVRNGDLAVTKDIIDLSLSSCDLIRSMLDAVSSGESFEGSITEGFIGSVRQLLPTGGGEAPPPTSPPPSPYPEKEPCGKGTEGVRQYLIRFFPPEDIMLRGLDPFKLLMELEELGHVSVTARMDDVPTLEALVSEKCYASWEVVLTTRCGIDAIKDVFAFVDEESLSIEEIDIANLHPDAEYKKLGEILIEKGKTTRDDLEAVLEKQELIGELLVSSGLVGRDDVASALNEQERIKEAISRRSEKLKTTTVRVESGKLDKLVDLVGEMVTAQASFSQMALQWDEFDILSTKGGHVSIKSDHVLALMSISERMSNLVAELRDNTMELRMFPIGSTFEKFRRLVRDLSAELGKEVQLLTEGGDTGLDKTVIDRLDDPMVHLIRNCIDHGIEPPSVREAADKPRMGTVRLSAEHSGASVLIRIMDDGRGFDMEAIKAKAVQKGLLSPGAELSEKDAFSIICEAGFSTAGEVTSVSGRGVGMDVVSRNIEALRGSININSQEGRGTGITLKLPLTLAIIDGLLVNIGQNKYIIPLALVNECVEMTAARVEEAHGRHLAHVRGEVVPYVPLREMFGIYGSPPELQQIVITGSNGSRVGLMVDDVIGEHQTVIKALGSMYKGVKCISGASILGDGTVSMILDINQIIKEVHRQECA